MNSGSQLKTAKSSIVEKSDVLIGGTHNKLIQGRHLPVWKKSTKYMFK